ncbi:hypothetical protein BDB00DRAFT_837832 [Zychaea mexicana]|uniref:uncharacterized protein n=1 Tax=Zychaea mexicana TaxID=64656 RepID=UPI0022FF23D0|nr:uncharacterized protein BDB00DRAFT_837832 [Zychaea mexicana]KAI9490438.1 hypothetical protein BDB00DRAFT_837832 [Zychaea mexicana]
MRATSSKYRSQEMLQELFEEINDYLGDRTTPVPGTTSPLTPPCRPSSKTAIEPANVPIPAATSITNNKSLQQDASPQPILVESDESEEDEEMQYHSQSFVAPSTQERRSITPQQQQQQQQCLLLCPVSEETPSVCMCYNCNKRNPEETHLALSKKLSHPRHPKRSWTSAASSGFGFGGIADKVKQTFANSKSAAAYQQPQQQKQYDNYSGYEQQRLPQHQQDKRSSSRNSSGPKRWIPRPKSLPALSAYVQKHQHYDDDSPYDEYDDDNEYHSKEHRRRSWNSKKNKSKTSVQTSDYADVDDSAGCYKVEEKSIYDGIPEKYETSRKEHRPKAGTYYMHREEHQQQQQQHVYDSYNSVGSVPSDQLPPSQQQYQQHQQPLQQYFSEQQQQQQFSPESTQEASPITETQSPLPGLTELPFLTPSTRVGEEHITMRMQESRALPTRQERMNAYNNAYYHCIMAKSDLIPWLTKQYSKGPPDAMFEYNPKPKKTPKKLFNIFKLCNTGNKDGSGAVGASSSSNQLPWQPSVSPAHLISSPTSASPAESTSLYASSNIQQPQQPQHSAWPNSSSSLLPPPPPTHTNNSETSASPSSNDMSISTPVSAIEDDTSYYNSYGKMSLRGGETQRQHSHGYEHEEEDEETFKPVLPRPRSMTSLSPSEPRPSRSSRISITSTKSDIQPVPILKKTRSSTSLQPRRSRYTDDEGDYDGDYNDGEEFYDDYGAIGKPKFLAAPSPHQQRHQRQQYNRRGHVKRRSFSQVEEPIYFMERRRPRRGSFYDEDRQDLYGDDDDDDLVAGEEGYIDDGYLEHERLERKPSPRMLRAARYDHPAFFGGSRLNHLRATSRGTAPRPPPPLWMVAPEEEIESDDDPLPSRRRRSSSSKRPSRPSSRNSVVTYDDLIPIPRSSPVYYY